MRYYVTFTSGVAKWLARASYIFGYIEAWIGYPRPADPDYEPPKRYLGLIDTNLWRLRKAIEPDPKNPILLITRRGLGVTLQVRW